MTLGGPGLASVCSRTSTGGLASLWRGWALLQLCKGWALLPLWGHAFGFGGAGLCFISAGGRALLQLWVGGVFVQLWFGPGLASALGGPGLASVLERPGLCSALGGAGAVAIREHALRLQSDGVDGVVFRVVVCCW